MPVALGPIIKEPWYVFLQLVYLFSNYVLLLGVALIVTGWLQGSVDELSQPTLVALFGGFPATYLHVPAALIQASVFGMSVARCVERRRLCLDFVGTIYFVFFLVCWIYGGFPKGHTWWISYILQILLSFGVARFITTRNEMQEVELSGITTGR